MAKGSRCPAGAHTAPVGRWLLGCLLAAAAMHASGSAPSVNDSEFVCVAPKLDEESLRNLTLWNCDLVNRTVEDYAKAEEDGKGFNSDQVDAWKAKAQRAGESCSLALDLLNGSNGSEENPELAAHYAINAWGSIITDGFECCTLTGPPYCTSRAVWSISTVAVLVPLGVLVLLLAASCLTSWCLPRKREEKTLLRMDTVKSHAPADGLATPRGAAADGGQLQAELRRVWLNRSCLRVLPGAPHFAATSSSVFGALKEVFDFQSDSVRNQYEHLLSLWRSQAAMVADRSVELSAQVDETELLAEALGDLHADLLDGFRAWREKFRKCRGKPFPAEVPLLPSMAGAGALWERGEDIGCSAAGESGEELSAKLAEVATFLLVWAEAGNLRFMPEVVYFITELALAADESSLEQLYGSSQAGGHSQFGPYRSGLFLSNVIRPMYNAIFDEWYECVDVDPSSQKDKKKLKSGYDNFLPADVANYDDWNEFFCDPQRLARGLILENGTLLFDLPHSQRFAALRKVDWKVSLDATETKTHREIHSLWGVFASTHRIWLVHSIMFFAGICYVAEDADASGSGNQPLLGKGAAIRFAAVCLLVPVHGAAWTFARWQVTGRAVRKQRRGGLCIGRLFWRTLIYSAPIATYAAVRATDQGGFFEEPFGDFHMLSLIAHYVVSGLGFFRLIFIPSTFRYAHWRLTDVPGSQRLVRYAFWFIVLGIKFFMGTIIFKAVLDAIEELHIAMPGRESHTEIAQVYFSTNWISQILRWVVLWCTTWLLFVSDTQLWFTAGCTILGVGTVLVQKGVTKAVKYSVEDAVAKIPERFSKKVLTYSKAQVALKSEKQAAPFSPYFPLIWDRAMEYMRYEDKVDNQLMGDLCFRVGEAGSQVNWQQLQQSLGRSKPPSGSVPSRHSSDVSGSTAGEQESQAKDLKKNRVKVPDVFREKGPFEIGFKHYCSVPDPHWPSNADVQWRIISLARGLGLPMPRPFRAPYIPGITVLIPHYGESILMVKKELFQESRSGEVPVIDWVKGKYAEEFSAFTSRMAVEYSNKAEGWPVAGSQWEDYTESQWDQVCAWSSMRMQTLWRTVAGMCLYHPALQCHYEAQRDQSGQLARQGIWNPSDCFTCLVSMQMYKFFDKTQLAHTNRMFEKFPDCLKVAFIDCEQKGLAAETDCVHPMQKRRYFSCLIDRGCSVDSEGRRRPKLRVELPGYPILGDGKGDNQNHALPFMRGVFSQCIDANQGAYFEQMLLLPNALGEFRSYKRGDGGSKRIIGFPEHITSDIGSIGDFAASAEVAFGTILQRTYAVLGGRMHYGHPDIMNKLFMIQQGGVSKATKTLNLSEDIFAGMDFTLRGEDRKIRHCEYFHLAKGRDLGFNTVLGFFSKLSSGTGEQVITRQTFRLGQVLHLPEALTFYYAHVGYYFTQFLVSTAMPLLVLAWLLVLLSDCESTFSALTHCAADRTPASAIMSEALGMWFSVLLLLFLVATSLPLFTEMWMERSLKIALLRFLTQMFTLSPLMFIFQAKIIGHYVVHELRYGGATYVSTGRGLPTERRPFIGEIDERGLKLKKVGGLYLDYAAISYYDGATLLAGAVLVMTAGALSGAGVGSGAGWIWLSLGLMIFSWLFAPFVFNPYQFDARHFLVDVRCLVAFFWEESGKRWADWYERTQLKPCSGASFSVVDVNFFFAFFFLAAFFESLNVKVEAFNKIYTEREKERSAAVLLPPLLASFAYCVLAVVVERILGCQSILQRRRRRRRPTAAGTRMFRGATSAPGAMRAEPGVVGRSASGALSSAERGQLGGALPPPEVEEGEDAHLAGEDSEDEENPEVEAHARVEDHPVQRQKTAVTRDGCVSEAPVVEPCCLGIPLAMSAIFVVLLDCVEAGAVLYDFYWVGWHNALLAGLILKWGMLTLLLAVGEGVLRAHCFRALGCLGLPIQLWVKAHRMARDMFCSSLIMLVLLPIVLLNYFNEKLCPGCSAHQLLIYRDPGHLARKEAIIVDMLDEGEDLQDMGGLLRECTETTVNQQAAMTAPSLNAMTQPAQTDVVL